MTSMPSSSGVPSPALRRFRDGGGGWLGLSALLAAGSLLVVAATALELAPAPLLDWQPSLVWRQPWRWWSAAWVHGSAAHLGANVLALALIAALGVVAALPRRVAIAWALAWPLTQLGLLLRPELAHYGGLSGVLHAGVALVACQLLLHGRGRQRVIAAALALGLVCKLLLEAPWGPLLQPSPLLGIAVVPWAHASGALAGVLAFALMSAVLRTR